MGYERDRDDRFRGQGEDESRWQGNRQEREGGSFGNWGSNRDRDYGGRERGREGDVRWQETGQGQFRGDPVHYREGGRGGGGFRGDEGGEYRGSSGGGWSQDRGQDRSRFQGGNSQDSGGGGGGYAGGGSQGGGGVAPGETWGGSGFGGLDDNGRRFDRIDAGSTGTQGAHPMSSPVDAGYGMGSSIGATGGMVGGGSSARAAAIIRQAQQQGGGQQGYGGQQYGQSSGQQYGRGDQHHHDRHYSEWRNRQIEELDRDYHEYRQEHQSKFEQEFGGWRQKRQTQRQHFGRVTEHMEVVGSDGQHLGTVDKVRGDKIILTKNDENAGGVHHSIPCSWIESVDDKLTINKTAQEAMAAWTSEDSNRALFERPDQGSDGPHVLNRSFAGTYDDKKD